MSDRSEYTRKDEVLRYLNNQMESEERNAFERLIEKDPFVQEAVEGLEQFNPSDMEHDLHHLSTKFSGKSSRKLVYVFGAAATLLILVAASFFFITKDNNSNELASEQQMKSSEKRTDTLQTIPIDARDTTYIATAEEEGDSISAEDAILTKLDTEPRELAIADKQPSGSSGANESKNLPKGVEIPKPERQEDAEMSKASKIVETVQTTEELDLEESKNPPIMIRGLSSSSHDTNFITGQVLDKSTNEPIPGVSIVAKGSDLGAVTNIDGYYLLKLPDTISYEFTASFVGMKDVNFNSDQQVNNLLMEENDLALDEVVTVGYGKQAEEKSDSLIKRRKAEPEMGWRDYRDYLKDAIVYPADSTATGRREVVELNVMVEADGTLSDIEVLKTAGEVYTREAIRVVKEGPKWLSEIKDWEAIAKKVEVRIIFRPEE